MPRTAITATQLTRNGNVAAPTFVAADAANGMQLTAEIDSRVFLYVKNGAGAGITVTIKGRGTYNDLAVTVGATSDRLIGPFETAFYEQTDENFYIDFSSGTTVTVAAIRDVMYVSANMTTKWFRIKLTGMEWHIAHADTIEALEKDGDYEEIEDPTATAEADAEAAEKLAAEEAAAKAEKAEADKKPKAKEKAE